MSKISCFDVDTCEVIEIKYSDVCVDLYGVNPNACMQRKPNIHRPMPKNIMEMKMFLMCIKTYDDFITLSDIIDQFPLWIDKLLAEKTGHQYTFHWDNMSMTRKHLIEEYILHKSRITYKGDYYIYSFRLPEQPCTSFIKNLKITVYIRNILSVEITEATNIMPMSDGFVTKTYYDRIEFIMKGNLWCYVNYLNQVGKRLVIKCKTQINLPLVIEYNYMINNTAEHFPIEKIKVIKTKEYWQLIRLNNGKDYKSEIYKITQ